MSESTPYQLDVESGLYSGLNIALERGTYIIGSDVNADIVFVEQGLDGKHVKLIISDGKLEIEALGGGIAVGAEPPLELGARAETAIPASLAIGDVRLRISDLRAGSAVIPFTRTASFRIGGLVACLAGIVALLTFAINMANMNAAAQNDTEQALVEVPSPANGAKQLDETETRKAADALKEQIESAGLLNIRVSAGTGVVTAEGTIPPVIEPDWQNLQKWFDHKYTSSLTLVNGVVVREEKLPSSIAVEAVWQGAQPYLLIRGQKYFVGAMLDDGWTIHRIESDRVLLRNEERLAAVKF